jgi:hypothetical protein
MRVTMREIFYKDVTITVCTAARVVTRTGLPLEAAVSLLS